MHENLFHLPSLRSFIKPFQSLLVFLFQSLRIQFNVLLSNYKTTYKLMLSFTKRSNYKQLMLDFNYASPQPHHHVHSMNATTTSSKTLSHDGTNDLERVNSLEKLKLVTVLCLCLCQPCWRFQARFPHFHV